MGKDKLGRLRLDTLKDIAKDKNKFKWFGIKTKFGGYCSGCESWIKKETFVLYNPEHKVIRHFSERDCKKND